MLRLKLKGLLPDKSHHYHMHHYEYNREDGLGPGLGIIIERD
jgi:hypothetical protein